jgi:Ubiquitin carboxyl-terminal hydrolase
MERLRNFIANPQANEPDILWAASAAFFVEEPPLNPKGSLKLAFGAQHDALEYLEYVLEAVKDLEQNEGKLQVNVSTTHTCDKCMFAADIPRRKENVLYVDLPKPRPKGTRTHLETLLNGSSSPTEKKWCDHCQENVAGVQDVNIHTNEVLIVCLKRFCGKGKKITTDIETPRELMYKQKTYRLRSQVDHVGTTTKSGHYIAHKMVDWKLFTISDMDITKPKKNVLESRQSYLAFYSEVKAGEVHIPSCFLFFNSS